MTFQRDDGSVDERMEVLAGKVDKIYDCLVGKLDCEIGLIDQVHNNTKFRKNIIKFGWTVVVATIGTIAYWIKTLIAGGK